MFKLRVLIALTIWWLFLFFNIERMDSTLNITPLVYVLVLVFAVMLIMIKRLSKLSSLLTLPPVLIAYVVLKQLLGYTILERGLATTVTEIAGISITFLLVREVLLVLHDFEDAIDKITFRQLGLPPRVYETPDAEDLYREVKRSRRFKHPLSLLVVRPQVDTSSIPMNDLMLELQRAMSARYFQARLVKFFSEELRDTDLVAIDGENFLVLLPETGEEQAHEVLEQVRMVAYQQMGIDLDVGMASFPDKALTFTGLVDAARRNLNSSSNGTVPLPVKQAEQVTASSHSEVERVSV